MRIRAVAVTAMLAFLLTPAVGCASSAPTPLPTNADLTGTWCGSSGDRIDLRQDGSSRLDPISDAYLSHLLQDLRDTWSDQYIWRTYFDGRRPASAQGTWLLSEYEDDDDHDDDDRWVRLDFGERKATAARDHESPQRYRFSDALLISHDSNGFELLALDGMPDEGWSSRFTPCSD
ncbi:hypothetical protein Q2K19_18990 [Micromonospora soli]|uniref:hypothetical protein n=1 Tax=Micromonospora sp. NBRC 110009 TaxID=3061627 RepID=UPI002674059E|nr:hypothetical protein [Micromonospora sp. NBRC 110009]WKT96309.1 hypothetical protein Q2K19_18990 [Micromonospora sp. NBRC 110009]